MIVLAYAALIRDGSATIYLAPYAEVGDLIFGTALLAAAAIAVFDPSSGSGDADPSLDLGLGSRSSEYEHHSPRACQ